LRARRFEGLGEILSFVDNLTILKAHGTDCCLQTDLCLNLWISGQRLTVAHAVLIACSSTYTEMQQEDYGTS
ncbi:MAG TPA: hypothetical protein VFV92_09125, partial [Candidatus Bathyarchaeia archaeon]|nr:hypothetical protein [Candidatus Bathyarchaeia archaeon]